MVPYWEVEGEGLSSEITDRRKRRAICLALVDSRLKENDQVSVDIRGKRVEALLVPYNLRSEAPPFSRPIIYDDYRLEGKDEFPKLSVKPGRTEQDIIQDVNLLLQKAVDNTRWRQTECINLIPSEQTQSPMTRLLSVMDPAFRYGEHKRIKAFYDADVFYYQGTGFIDEVEKLLEKEMRAFLGCREVETRVISGQMANMAVFSALVDYLNRGDRRQEQRRIRSVMNNHIIKGG
ncbi:Serine hydroxymethyltransferase [subsurface metagenome]